jgi:hypothetical protein
MKKAHAGIECSSLGCRAVSWLDAAAHHRKPIPRTAPAPKLAIIHTEIFVEVVDMLSGSNVRLVLVARIEMP